MSDDAPRTTCEICGGPLRRGNKIGICRRNKECERARWRKQKAERSPRPKRPPKTCKHPDGCTRPHSSHGWCGMHWWRIQRYGEPGPATTLRRNRIVLAGDTFGRWTALEDYTEPAQLRIQCECECGVKRPVSVDALLAGHTKSCGCLGNRPRRNLPKRQPYLKAGQVFALLTILRDVAYSTDWAECRCECGTEVKRRAVSVKSGNTRSCGCYRRKHGFSKHPLYWTWYGIVRRATVPTDKDYPSYGGRGIGLFEGWQGMPDGFLRFVSDVGNRPDGHTLDRIDNDKGYEPDNVRWAPAEVQNGNKRTVDAVTQERDELARENAALRAQLLALTG